MAATIKILGLDPGLQRTGWGVIELQGNRLQFVGAGVVESTPKAELPLRLVELDNGISAVLEFYKPTDAAVEETFVNVNAKTTLKLGMARGVVLMAPAKHNIKVGEYSANTVKKSVVGVGHAAKEQVDMMVKRLLPTAKIPGPDAADALAVAICHAHHLMSARAGIKTGS